MKDFVVVAIFTYPHEYTVLRHILEDEGIPYVFENETIVNVTPFYSNALGGIRLKVHREDAEAAIAIIKNMDNNGSLRIV
ncbi:putative signal transducing protein [Sinomicrobium sp. M5D2P17]